MILQISFGSLFLVVPAVETTASSSLCPLAPADIVLIIDRSGSMDDTSSCIWWEFKCINPPSCSSGYSWVKNTTYNLTQAWCTAKNQSAPYQSVWTQYSPLKINAATSSANTFLDLLKPEDQSALVSYANTANLDKTLSSNHNQTKTAVNSLIVSGATDIGNAIKLGADELTTSGRANLEAAKAMILLTDGMANKPNGPGTGEWPADVAYAKTKADQAGNLGIKIFTIGLGGDVNNTMLEYIASTTGASYYYAPSGADLTAIYNSIALEICEYSSISGYKWLDTDKSKTWDASETELLLGWEIVISGPDSFNAATTTDINGYYEFSGLVPGSYTLTETLKPGWIQTYPVIGSHTVEIIGWNKQLQNNNFGNYQPVCGNEILDDGEECDDGVNGSDTCTADCKWKFECTTDQDCNDGLYCTGQETCIENECVNGTQVICSDNDIYGINTCTNNPDDNPYTYDLRLAYTSECNESTDSCTTGNLNINHTCDVTQCQAECDATHACADTICSSQNGCVGNDYYTYSNEANSCQGDCACTDNTCGEPQISYNDPACTDCQTDADCNSLNQDYCDGTSIKHNQGVCVEYSCQAQTTTVQDCNNGLSCDGQETCSLGACVTGTAVDCSGNNIAGIGTCSYAPDNNPYTYDTRNSFTSSCQEPTGTCSTGDTAITSSCIKDSCGATCLNALDCDDQNILTIDSCNSSTCQCNHSTEPSCGDGIVNQPSEQCDGTAGVGEHQTCSQTCTLINLPYCGDAVCSNGETCSSCVADCGGCGGGTICGDGIKNNEEQCDGTAGVGEHQACSNECTLANVPYCGDGSCNNSESCSSCSTDCGSCGGGGGGGSGGGAIIPTELIISSEASRYVDQSIVVTWLTNKPATSRVIYDTVPHPDLSSASAPNYGYAFSTVLDENKVTGHSVTISGLTPGTTYYLRPLSSASPEKYGIETAITTAGAAIGGGQVLDEKAAAPPAGEVLGIKITAPENQATLKATGFSSREFGWLITIILLLSASNFILRKYEKI